MLNDLETEQIDYFMDEHEIITDIMLNQLDEQDKLDFKRITRENLPSLHQAGCQGIKNYYRMWDKNNPYTNVDDITSPNYPEEMSRRVLDKVWAKLTGNQYIERPQSIVDNGDGTYTIPGLGVFSRIGTQIGVDY